MKKQPILVVDDQLGVRKLLQEALKDLGDVELAASGPEALAKVGKVPPAVMVMDMKMPGMNGLEVLEELKRVPYYGPVIMMTAYGELEIVNQAKKLGVSHYITKPFDIDEMRALVVQVLGEKGI
ncbi:MAG: response regulator [Bacillota bacterium]